MDKKSFSRKVSSYLQENFKDEVDRLIELSGIRI